MKYDYLIVGAGLFGAVFACEARKKGKKCLVIDKRDHIAGKQLQSGYSEDARQRSGIQDRGGARDTAGGGGLQGL